MTEFTFWQVNCQFRITESFEEFSDDLQVLFPFFTVDDGIVDVSFTPIQTENQSINCNIRSNVTSLRIVRWLLGYVGFVIPVHTACIKLVIRNLSSYYIGDED